MKLRNLVAALASVTILMATLAACGGGSSGSASDAHSTNPTPTLSIVGNTTIALGGSEVFTITIKNAQYLANSVSVSISNSNASIANMIENTCNQSALTKDSPQCTITLSGTQLGNSSITVSAIGYTPVIHDLSVLHQWGGVGGDVYDYTTDIHIVGDTIYSTSDNMIYKSESGKMWQTIDKDGLDVVETNIDFADNSICVATSEQTPFRSINTLVNCSFDNSSWKKVGQFNGYYPQRVSIYHNHIYLIIDGLDASTIVESCSLNNCVQWQQQGDPIYTTHYNNYLDSSTAYIQESSKLYYQNETGKWQLYGTYISHDVNLFNNIFAFSNNDAVLLPLSSIMPPYVQHVYFLESSNIGESFTDIGNGVLITSLNQLGYADSSIVFHNNSIYISTVDGKVYTSTRTNNIWSAWQQVGDSPYPLSSIAISPDGSKLYAIVKEIDHKLTKVFVYKL